MDQGESTGGGGPGGGEVGERLRRVEEHCGFTEHTVEQLSAEMVELGKRVLELSRRIEGIERRLGELARAGAEGTGGASGEGDPGASESAPPA
jgi:uncharacterized coiled-coil protein SlyX